jgi:hypothetical protein
MKFIALPVSQGDAFYAETDGFRVLVDGGRSRTALQMLFRKYAKSDKVDILVCTHNDADHAEGVIGFLQSGLRCKELWLPTTWLDAIVRLPANPYETFRLLNDRFIPLAQEKLPDETEDDVQEAAWRAVFPKFQESSTQLQREELPTSEESDGSVSVGDVFTDIEALEQHIDLLEHYIDLLCCSPRYWRSPFPYGDKRGILAKTVLRDTRRLMELARLALHLGIPIRCFRHEPQNARPVAGCSRYPLYSLSGPQVYRVSRPKPRREADSFFQVAFLTTVNRESLVCYLDSGNGPGVLFTADSDLKDMDLQNVRRGDIVTAPHHGSTDNRDAYGRIGKPVMWVRSDGYSKRRPCAEYLSAPQKRFCTLCRDSRQPKQAVKLSERHGTWVPVQTRGCACR